jgi:hypothetical protein
MFSLHAEKHCRQLQISHSTLPNVTSLTRLFRFLSSLVLRCSHMSDLVGRYLTTLKTIFAVVENLFLKQFKQAGGIAGNNLKMRCG